MLEMFKSLRNLNLFKCNIFSLAIKFTLRRQIDIEMGKETNVCSYSSEWRKEECVQLYSSECRAENRK